jgi:VWFA-related protein
LKTRSGTARARRLGGALPLLPLLAAAQTPPPSPTPPEPPRFPAAVELVVVDVVATDGKGMPVTDLSREDFVVREDGRPQHVSSFEAVRVPAAAAPPPPGRVSANTPAPAQAARTYVLVFDDLNLTPFLAQRAKAAGSRFLQAGVRDGDQVLLLSTAGSAWWSARMPAGRDELAWILDRLEGRLAPDTAPDRITPWEAMRIHLYRDLQIAARVGRRLERYGAILPAGPGTGTLADEYRFNFENPVLVARAQAVYLASVSRNRLTLEVLERALDALALGRGRKSVVLVSEGFFHDPNMPEFKGVLEAARRANAALYFLDARGLSGLPLAASAEFGQALEPRDLGAAFTEDLEASEGTELLASESGGFSVKNANDLGKGFDRIAAESASYYLLGYRSDNAARDGRFRRIAVETRRKGVRLRARTGYYAPAAEEGAAAQPTRRGDPQLEAALNSPFDQPGIPLRASAFVFEETLLGKAKVVLVAELDVRGLALREAEGRLAGELDTLVVVAQRETGEFHRQDQKLELKLLPDAREKLGRDWYAMTRDLDLAPGRYQARIVVREPGSGRVGALSHDFEVGALGALRLSTPVLGDALHQGEAGRHPVMTLRRAFAPDAALYGEYQVYGAAKDPGTGLPRVASGFELRRSNGEVLMRVAPTAMRPTSLGGLSRIVVAPLAGAVPGDYELVLRLRDEAAGAELEAREPFAVEAPARP